MADATPKLETQTQRRVKYGLNVLIAAVAAIALVVLVNWIVDRNFRDLPPGMRDWLRADWTATRQYSLSEQTQRVLGNLEKEHRIVSLFRRTGPQLEHVADLIDEYASYSDRLTVEHIDPDMDFGRRDKFFADLRGRYAEQLKPTIDAIEQGREAARKAAEALVAQGQALREAAAHPELPDGPTKELIQAVIARGASLQQELGEIEAQITRALDEPLPAYSSLRNTLQSLLSQLDANVLGEAVTRFERVSSLPDVPSGVKDRLLGVSNELKAVREGLRPALDALRDAQPVEAYERLVSSIGAQESVIVLGPEQVRVINVADMFRAPDPEMIEETGQREAAFLGEEKLTGALVSLSVEKPAMVVFVISGQQAAIGPRGEYEYVAQRLRSANFDVRQWNPTGQFSPMGGQLPAEPPPQAEEGQKTVWIILPGPPANPMNPMASQMGKPQIADLLKDRLPKGDAALFTLSFDATAGFGAPDPVLDVLKGFGITPQLDRAVFQEIQVRQGRTQPSAQFPVDSWPKDHPVSAALSGLRGVFVLPSPLILAGEGEGERWPLVNITGQRLWGEKDLGMMASQADIKYEEADAAPSFTVAAAAEKGDQRVVVVASGGMPGVAPSWASNQITTMTQLGPSEELVNALGAVFPANSELFVNSVYWLANLDQLIAASARTQDIRRITDLSDQAVLGTRLGLLVGAPVVIAAVGIGVALVRRRA